MDVAVAVAVAALCWGKAAASCSTATVPEQWWL